MLGRDACLWGVQFERVFDAEEVLDEKGVWISGGPGVEGAKGVLELAYTIAHLYYLCMELLGVCEDEPGGG